MCGCGAGGTQRGNSEDEDGGPKDRRSERSERQRGASRLWQPATTAAGDEDRSEPIESSLLGLWRCALSVRYRRIISEWLGR